MNTYGVYFEFDTDVKIEGQVHAQVANALRALQAKINHLSIEGLWSEPVAKHQLSEQPPLGHTHDFFDGIPSIGEGDPNDVFKYPHIKQLLDHLGMREDDNGPR